eukprot:SAG31_NODE_5593_length_2434_cov_1.981156_4_plen_200_part_00
MLFDPVSGGHIAAMLARVRPVRGVVLFYPVLDVLDSDEFDSGVSSGTKFMRLPFSFDWAGMRAGQSTIAWFFARVVLGVAASDVDSTETANRLRKASPLRLMPTTGSGYPPTLLLHGSVDGHVPIAHSREYMSKVDVLRTTALTSTRRLLDALIEVATAPHSFDMFCNTRTTRVVTAAVVGWMRRVVVEGADEAYLNLL